MWTIEENSVLIQQPIKVLVSRHPTYNKECEGTQLLLLDESMGKWQLLKTEIIASYSVKIKLIFNDVAFKLPPYVCVVFLFF